MRRLSNKTNKINLSQLLTSTKRQADKMAEVYQKLKMDKKDDEINDVEQGHLLLLPPSYASSVLSSDSVVENSTTRCSRYYCDDMIFAKSKQSNRPIEGDLIIRFHGKLKRAWNLLQDINLTLANSTTEEILKHKPTFDQEKRKLIKYQSWVEKLYKTSLVSPQNDTIHSNYRLSVKTGFKDWNNLSFEINNLAGTINEHIQLNRKRTFLVHDSSNQSQDETHNKRTSTYLKYICLLLILIFILVFTLYWELYKK